LLAFFAMLFFTMGSFAMSLLPAFFCTFMRELV